MSKISEVSLHCKKLRLERGGLIEYELNTFEVKGRLNHKKKRGKKYICNGQKN